MMSHGAPYGMAGSPAPPPPLPTNYPGLRGGRGMAHGTWQACVDVLRRIYNANDRGRRMGDAFRDYPNSLDYHRVIREPESLDNIAVELGRGNFESPESFFKQLHLVFLNAKNYHESDSMIWQDAKRLEDQMLVDWRTMTSAGQIPNAQPTQLLPVMPRKRGRPPTNPKTIAANAAAARNMSMMNMNNMGTPPASRIPGTFVFDPNSSPYASSSTSSPAYPHPPVPQNLNMAMNMGAGPVQQPHLNRQRSDSNLSADPGAVAQSDKMRQGAQSPADQAIVAALDARLPRWKGPELTLPGKPSLAGIPGSGWWGEAAPDHERTMGGERMWTQRMKTVLVAIQGYRDVSGIRLAEALESVPTVTSIPYLSFNAPLSFESIRLNVDAGRYRSLRDFDLDMCRLFEKARRHHSHAQPRSSNLSSPEHGKVLVLQRLYNALTAPYPMQLPPSGIPAPTPNLFASLPAGPGNARPMHEINNDLKSGVAEENAGFGVTTFRVGSKERIFTDEARHKGMAYRVGDFVHLINPDDATKPIVGQVFKSFVPTKGLRTHHVTVCWYYYPEQTVHPPEQLFYEREVFKTGHFCDHPVEDIIERISVQFYVKAIRGRPLAPEYYPGWPIYVCNSRYNDREQWFVRVKNWNSCIPDELRQTNFMTVEPFDRQIELGVVTSPFQRGITGPGSFGESKKSTGDDEEDDSTPKRATPLPKGAAPSVIYPGVNSGTPTGGMINRPPPPQHMPPQQPMTAMPARPAMGIGMGMAGNTSVGGMQQRPSMSQYAPNPAQQPPMGTGAAQSSGQRMGEMTVREQLPAETIRLFERDSRGNVLWFSAPPLPPGSIKIPEQPIHSIEYLEYLTKRKQGDTSRPERPAKRLVADSESGSPDATTPPTSDDAGTEGGKAADGTEKSASAAGGTEGEDEDFREEWWAKDMTEDQVFASLQAVVERA